MNEDNNMVFDTDTFDFFSLTDIKEEAGSYEDIKGVYSGKRPTISAEDVSREPTFEPEESEDEEFTLFDKDEHKAPFDPNSDTSDLIGQSYEDQAEAAERFHSLDDYAVIDLGDGVQLTKADTTELARSKQRISEERAFYEAASKADFSQLDEYISDRALMLQTETEKQIQAITNALENPLTPVHEKGELYDRLTQTKAKYDVINRGVQEAVQARNTQKAALARYRIENTRNAMKQKYGDKWTKEAGEVFGYAIQSGISERMIADNLDPALADIFLKARAYDIEMQKRQAKTKQAINQSWARSKASAQSSKANTTTSKEAYLKRQARNGDLTPDEVSQMFNYLVD